MGRFAGKTALLIFTVFFSNLAFYFLLPSAPDSDAYLAAINDKYARLEATSAPRIIFVGTSDLAYGLDSSKIEAAFGMPVVNLGLHAGIGIRTSLDSLRSVVQPGDIIIICAPLDPIPNEFFYGYDDGTGQHLWMLKFRPSLLSALNSPYQWRLLFREYPNFINTMRGMAYGSQFQVFYMHAIPGTINRRDSFNQYGDLISHLARPSLPQTPLNRAAFATPDSSQYPKIVAYFNQYADFVNNRGARIYTTWPPQFTPENSEPLTPFVSERQIAVYESGTSTIAIPMLGSPRDYQFPPDFFYEIPGHLNAQGRAARTQQLIKDLSREITARENASNSSHPD